MIKKNIIEQYEKVLGKNYRIFNDLNSSFDIDIIYFYPHKLNPFHIFVTVGRTVQNKLKFPNESNLCGELGIVLPGSWPINMTYIMFLEDIYDDVNVSWPIAWLKYISTYSYESCNPIFIGDTLTNGYPMVEFASNTTFSAFFVDYPSNLGPLGKIEIRDFSCLWPIHSGEYELVQESGFNTLRKLFVDNGSNEIMDLNRHNLS